MDVTAGGGASAWSRARGPRGGPGLEGVGFRL